jgi:hypothetical protein
MLLLEQPGVAQQLPVGCTELDEVSAVAGPRGQLVKAFEEALVRILPFGEAPADEALEHRFNCVGMSEASWVATGGSTRLRAEERTPESVA